MTRTLLVCSGGGHLKQLFTLAGRLGIDPHDQFWATFENGLSHSLLANREVEYLPFAGPRDAVNIAKIAFAARRIIASGEFDRAISTGSSPAVAFLPQAASRGVQCHYIESAARADGPSVSGRIISRFKQISTYTQYPAWSNERWQYRGSIFDEFEAGERKAPVDTIRKAVVSVGTQDGYAFDRLYRALSPLLAGADVLWQTGPQDVTQFGIRGARASVPHSEMQSAVAQADVVVAHAGTGAALTAIEANKCPVLVPRRSAHREHVDDHQLQIAGELDRRGLAIMAAPDELSTDVLQEASARSILRVDPGPFVLDDPPESRTVRSLVRPL